MPKTAHFGPELFTFLRELAVNNERGWFQANRERYEEHVRGASLRFVTDFAPRLAAVSRHFRADARPVGGSLFRIQRDIRFSRDKSPYKTAVGIQFRHEAAADVHAPGFYVHLEPGELWIGGGVWHPDPPVVRRIRDAIVARPDRWRRAAHSPAFRRRFELGGEALKRTPPDYPADHPFQDDLKLKDFVAGASPAESAAIRAGFIDDVARIFRELTPFMRFLCEALDLPF
ncbi:MAG: DUF2461 domain-containing protein [Deltaproteobacteria bacterium]|nr:DUF2461 domain-containing protein [Deltaproteobacteria bacterium]